DTQASKVARLLVASDRCKEHKLPKEYLVFFKERWNTNHGGSEKLSDQDLDDSRKMDEFIDKNILAL
ncbi:MAG: hypothetical protein LBD11_02475, partial [Candidatus Peribacteria bacterium]|nr:hypothetical protein [Candidatus Peribacteria bacterium]